jgi:hypothetical protein
MQVKKQSIMNKGEIDMSEKEAKPKAEAKAAEKVAEAKVMVVHAGNDYPLDWSDLNLATEPGMTSDVDILAACEEKLDLKPGSLGNSTIKRPATGRVLISGRATLG